MRQETPEPPGKTPWITAADVPWLIVFVFAGAVVYALVGSLLDASGGVHLPGARELTDLFARLASLFGDPRR